MFYVKSDSHICELLLTLNLIKFVLILYKINISVEAALENILQSVTLALIIYWRYKGTKLFWYMQVFYVKRY